MGKSLISARPPRREHPEAGLTLFAVPKPFRGHVGIIQANAIEAWSRLEIVREIILFGSAEGTAHLCSRLHLRHEPEIETNAHGTPLVSALFRRAQELARNPIMAYVNADIVLLSDFARAVRVLCESVGERSFLAIGRRWDVDFDEPIRFDDGWESRLSDVVRKRGVLHSPGGIDYFIFRKGLYRSVPAFAIGRTAWDNWLVYQARRQRAAVVDCTGVATAIHQNHDYSHHPAGAAGVWTGREAEGNQAILRESREPSRGYSANLDTEDATHCLTSAGMRPAWRVRPLRAWLRRQVQRAPVLHPVAGVPVRLALAVYRGVKRILTGRTSSRDRRCKPA